ncbi:MAG TPA: alpha/beta hydrolase [Bacillus bacterium]|nr:alpha/beta hydrolase [Bacillus sp. (in: firmicutes)]
MLIIFFASLLLMYLGLYFYNIVEVKKGEESFPPKGKFVTVDSVRLHYYIEGEGKPIVFLHGAMLSGNDYKDVLHLAASQGYQGLAFDRPGYGYSDRPEGKVTPISQAALIREALKEIGVDEPIIIVGHSWSGTMTLSYAQQFPEEVAGIVLLGAAMFKEGYPAENGDALSKIVTTPIAGDFILNTLLRTALGKGLAKSTVNSTFFPENAPEEYLEETIALGFRPDQFKANREDVLEFPKTSKKISSTYSNIDIPTIVVVGEKDPFGTIEQGKRLINEITNSQLQVIPNIGHMIPILHPTVVMEAVDLLKPHKFD